jgi:hypothetical protein
MVHSVYNQEQLDSIANDIKKNIENENYILL